MAEGGGAEVIFQVRSVLPDVRVLVMSGYADDEAMRRGIAEGKYPFLQKPFTSDQLAVAVDRALVG
jgi:DNA-binding NtrC family response regulator